MADLVKALQQLAAETGNGLNPVIISTGVVVSVDPLKIQIDQKTTLLESMLRLTTAVEDYEAEMTIQGSSTDGEASISGTTKMIVHNGLKIGESVLLIREQGGQKYTVVDRVVS